MSAYGVMIRYLDRSEYRKIEIKILKAINDICKKNGLQYFMCGGTMLGAIRHKGFIPWDDDIDVALLRKDYDRLIQLLKTQEEYKWLGVLDYETKGYYYTFAKAVDKTTTAKMEDNLTSHGIWVDIFPYDNLPDNPKTRKKFILKGYFYRSIVQSMTFDSTASNIDIKKRIIKNALKIYAKMINKENFIKKYIKFSKKYAETDTQYVGCLFSPYKMRECFLKNWFEEPRLYIFENDSFYGPNDYDSFLKQLYGNYMQLPPEDKRRNHRIIAWINDNTDRME